MQVSPLLTALGLSLSFYTSANVVDNAGNFGEKKR